MSSYHNVVRTPNADDIANARQAIANLDAPPASARFQQGRTTGMAKRIADMVRERGIRKGTLAIRIARKIDSSVYHGQVLTIAGAEFTVVDPAQAEDDAEA